MASAIKTKLSASTDGKAVKVVATATTGTTIHTAVSGTTLWDEIWLWAYNSHTASVDLTIEFGGTTNPDNRILQTISIKSGLVLIIPGLILQNGAVVTAYAGTANVVTLTGFINQITN